MDNNNLLTIPLKSDDDTIEENNLLNIPLKSDEDTIEENKLLTIPLNSDDDTIEENNLLTIPLNSKDNNNTILENEKKLINIYEFSNEIKIELTIQKIENIINTDRIELNIYLLKKTINDILLSSIIIEKIQNDILNIISDWNFCINDISSIIHIIINCEYLIQFLKPVMKDNINKQFLKYIIYSILYFFMLNDNKIYDIELEILNIFEKIWLLIEFDIKLFYNNKKSIFSKCFQCLLFQQRR